MLVLAHEPKEEGMTFVFSGVLGSHLMREESPSVRGHQPNGEPLFSCRFNQNHTRYQWSI